MRERDKIAGIKSKSNLRNDPQNTDKVYITDHISDKTLREHNILQNIARQLNDLNHFAYVPNMIPRQMHYKPSTIKDDRSKRLLVYKMEDFYAGNKIPEIPENIYMNRKEPLILPKDQGIVFLGKEQLLSNFNSDAPFVLEGEKWDMVERLRGVDQARKAGDNESEAILLRLENPHHIKAHFNIIKWKNMAKDDYDMKPILKNPEILTKRGGTQLRQGLQ